jgi:hypothetical protein
LGRTLNVDPLYLADLGIALQSAVNEPVPEREMKKLEGKLAWVRAVNSGEAEKLAGLAVRLAVVPGE